jgi:hypothetical protein
MVLGVRTTDDKTKDSDGTKPGPPQHKVPRHNMTNIDHLHNVEVTRGNSNFHFETELVVSSDVKADDGCQSDGS